MSQTACRRFWSVVVSICFNPLAAEVNLLWADSRWWNCTHFWIFSPGSLGKFMIQFVFCIFFKWVGLKLNHQLWAAVFSTHKNHCHWVVQLHSQGWFWCWENLRQLGTLGSLGVHQIWNAGDPWTQLMIDQPPMKWMKPTGFQDSIWRDI